MERRKQIEIEEQEIKRKEKELISTVRLPAEAEAYKVQTVAEGMRCVLERMERIHKNFNSGLKLLRQLELTVKRSD